MEEKLNKLRTSLDKTIYNNISFEEQMQDATIEKLKNTNSKNRRSYKPMFATLVAIAVAILLVYSFDFTTAHRNSANLGNEVESSDVIENQSINYLVVVTREDEPSILLININNETKEVKYVSVPHNLYVDDILFKNPTTAEVIEKALSIDITNVFIIDDNELGNFIELNKEIKVNNEFDFKHGDNMFKEGVITFNEGQKLIDFISMRKSDPRNYFGRNVRVVSILEELFKQETFYSDILKKEINKFDKILLSNRNIKLEDSVVFEEQYVEGVYSEKISRESLEVLKQSFGL